VLSLYALGFVVYACVPLRWLRALRTGDLASAVGTTVMDSWTALQRAPLQTLFDGPPGGFHLWFLMSLACGLAALELLRRGAPRPPTQLPAWRARGATVAFWVGAVGLFAFGLMAGRYAHTPLGLSFTWSTRNGPFQAVLLVAVGAALAWSGVERGAWWRGPALLALGQLILLGEAALLDAGPPAAGPDTYSLAVLPLGVGAFLTFFDLRLSSDWAQRAAVRLGGTTLGVYLWHVLLRAPLTSALGALGLYPHSGVAPWWGFIALFTVSVGAVETRRWVSTRVRRRKPRAAVSVRPTPT